MKTSATAQDSGWNISFWFAVSSPLLGILLGTLAAMVEEVMSITAFVFVLIILLFGFDQPGQFKSPPATRSRLTRSVPTQRFAEGI